MTKKIKFRYKFWRRLNHNLLSLANKYNTFEKAFHLNQKRKRRDSKSKKTMYSRILKEKHLIAKYYGNITKRSLSKIARQIKSIDYLSALFGFLEKRFQTLVFRTGIPYSMFHANQLITHKHIKLNCCVVNSSNHILRQGDIVDIQLFHSISLSFLRKKKNVGWVSLIEKLNRLSNPKVFFFLKEIQYYPEMQEFINFYKLMGWDRITLNWNCPQEFFTNLYIYQLLQEFYKKKLKESSPFYAKSYRTNVFFQGVQKAPPHLLQKYELKRFILVQNPEQNEIDLPFDISESNSNLLMTL